MSPCIDLEKKRVVLSIAKKVNEVDLSKNDLMIETAVIEESFSMMSPKKFVFSPTSMGLDAVNQGNLLRTPKTPCAEVYESESGLEALPMDLLVSIICHLHHDQLRAVFHVSQRIKKAVVSLQLHYTK
ncbi:hypothetical protein Ancab_026635 [Ancistrocladus abbreviatus]